MSTIKELVRRWYPSVDNQRPLKVGAHRALDDIRDSLRPSCSSTASGSSSRPAGRAVRAERDTEHACRGRAGDERRRGLNDPGCIDTALRRRDADGVRAVTVPTYGGPDVLTLADVADPVPGPDEILVRVTHSACNRADTLQRMGGYPDPVRRDVEILGLEYAGTVAALGDA